MPCLTFYKEAFTFLKLIFAQLFKKTQLSFSSLSPLLLVHGWKNSGGTFSSKKLLFGAIQPQCCFVVVLIFCVIGCDADPLRSDGAHSVFTSFQVEGLMEIYPITGGNRG